MDAELQLVKMRAGVFVTRRRGAAAAAAAACAALLLLQLTQQVSPAFTPFDRFFLGEEGMKQNECTFSLKSSFKGVKGQRSDLEKIDGGSQS